MAEEDGPAAAVRSPAQESLLRNRHGVNLAAESRPHRDHTGTGFSDRYGRDGIGEMGFAHSSSSVDVAPL